MKHLLSAIALTTLVCLTCAATPGAIPTGTWKYRLLVNGAPIGSAVITTTLTDGTYVTVTDMTMEAGIVKNRVRQVVTEGVDFRPLKLEIYNTTETDGKKTEMNTVASFQGKTVKLETGGTAATITITRPFVLEGNFHLHELIKHRFKKGTVIQSYIYEPTIEAEEPVLVMVKVMGRASVPVGGKTRELIHLGYSIENMKNIDFYIDESGVTQKAVIVMLNNRMELEIL